MNSDLETYINLFKKSLKQTILSTIFIKIIASGCFIMSFISSYILVSLAEKTKNLIFYFKTENLEKAIISFMSLSIVSIVVKYSTRIVYNIFLQRICRNQFITFIKEYLDLNYPDFHKKTPGEIRYAVFLKSFASVMCGQMVVFDLSTLLGTSFFSFLKITKISNFYSGVVFAVTPVIYISAVLFFIYIRINYQLKHLKEQEKISSKLYDKLINYDLIKTYSLEEDEANKFYKDLSNQMTTYVDLGIVDARGYVFLNILQVIPYILLVLLAFNKSENNKTSNLIQATILYTNLSHQLKKIGRELCALVLYLTQIKYADIQTNLLESNSSEMITIKKEIPSFKNFIKFQNVNLFYKSKIILNDINIIINKGEKIAILGPNGTGKSTFIKTLLGFTRFTGNIFIDEYNTKEVSKQSLLKNISYISQNNYISNDTILNNLRQGNKNATDDFIKSKAKLFDLNEDFENLSEGYQTLAGPGGNKLSGGQLQKISFLRAVIKDAPIFILDEATSAMDKVYESNLIQKLWKNFTDKTILMIVHGKKHLKDFDRIFFFNKGFLESAGSYDYLITNSENFRNFIL